MRAWRSTAMLAVVGVVAANRGQKSKIYNTVHKKRCWLAAKASAFRSSKISRNCSGKIQLFKAMSKATVKSESGENHLFGLSAER
ncbi:hypothetical protein C8R47DRAFT_1148674 [Mycena vitilis]|nr:hypothetical protein C8R47DRAFT_1148674 [Mycena vitilis]